MNIAELLNPKNDYVFKRIFGYTGNEEITFIQLEGVNGKSLFEIDTPSVNGKGIRLVKVDGQNSVGAKFTDNGSAKVPFSSMTLTALSLKISSICSASTR